jgi:4-hydroxythreonine-4-phosphate dehydrogenase
MAAGAGADFKRPDGAPIAVTMGDPSGIGPEITVNAWIKLREGAAPFFVIADPELLRKRAAPLGVKIKIVDEQGLHELGPSVFREALPVLPLANAVKGEPGVSHASDAQGTIESIEKAVELISRGAASAVVTNPITKDALYRTGFAHPGHTEFLAELSERYFHIRAQSVMMLWCDELAVVPVTIHVSLQRVLGELTTDLIVDTAAIAARDLRDKFGISQPRLAISGLNPHAGENGAMGTEDRDIIAPAVAQLRAMGIDARGPLPADTMFHAAARKSYDVAICMYHDQALIPIKTIAFDEGVNVTLGLPFIRTSPDHGTAYDIAGKGIARADSLIAALHLAGRLVHAQQDKTA